MLEIPDNTLNFVGPKKCPSGLSCESVNLLESASNRVRDSRIASIESRDWKKNLKKKCNYDAKDPN